jgi:plastocyanin
MRRSLLATVTALAAMAALALATVGNASSGAAQAKTIKGVVGPGFTITVNKRSVKAGKYTFTVQDKSSSHNWHITGPGVNRKTTVAGTGTVTWTLTLKKGTYTIVCDPHASSMRTTLRVT